MIYADANLFIYAAVSEEIGDKAEAFINENLADIATSVLTIDEVIWILSKQKDYSEAISVGEKMASGNIMLLPATGETALEAIKIMRENGLRPRDAFHAATMKQHGITKIASEDKDFDKLPWTRRVWV
jgi:hypothetical protein